MAKAAAAASRQVKVKESQTAKAKDILCPPLSLDTLFHWLNCSANSSSQTAAVQPNQRMIALAVSSTHSSMFTSAVCLLDLPSEERRVWGKAQKQRPPFVMPSHCICVPYRTHGSSKAAPVAHWKLRAIENFVIAVLFQVYSSSKSVSSQVRKAGAEADRE